MNIGTRVRTFLVEPLKPAVSIPAEEHKAETVPEPEEKTEEVPISK